MDLEILEQAERALRAEADSYGNLLWRVGEENWMHRVPYVIGSCFNSDSCIPTIEQLEAIRGIARSIYAHGVQNAWTTSADMGVPVVDDEELD